MYSRHKTGSTQATVQQLLQCLAQFTGHAEQQLSQLTRTVTVFHTKIESLKKKCSVPESNKPRKAEVTKEKNQQNKVTKQKNQEQIDCEPMLSLQVRKLFQDDPSYINVDQKDDTKQYNKGLSSFQTEKDEQFFDFSLGQDFGLQQKESSYEDAWDCFFASEADRIKSNDIEATIEDMLRFTQDKWHKMSESQKALWKYKSNPKGNKSAKKQRKEPNAVDDDKIIPNRLASFLQRKMSKSNQAKVTEQNTLEKGLKQPGDQKTVSATDLIIALEKNREKKKNQSKMISTDKFESLFEPKTF